MLFSAMISLAMTTAALAVALPHGLVTSDAEWCQGLGGGAFDTAPNFTLAAYDTTGQNANNTGSPLVLTEASTDGSNVYMAFATFASEPDNTFSSFNLNAGVLTPNPGNTGANVTDLNVTSGQAPEFQASTDGDNANLPQPVQVYCAIANTDPNGGGSPYPVLAVNKDSDSFSLCTSTAGDSNGQDIVIYEASESSTDYDFNSCVPVHIQLIGLN